MLWERNSALDAALSRSIDWQQVRRGRIAVLYVRKQPLSLGPSNDELTDK